MLLELNYSKEQSDRTMQFQGKKSRGKKGRGIHVKFRHFRETKEGES